MSYFVLERLQPFGKCVADGVNVSSDCDSSCRHPIVGFIDHILQGCAARLQHSLGLGLYGQLVCMFPQLALACCQARFNVVAHFLKFLGRLNPCSLLLRVLVLGIGCSAITVSRTSSITSTASSIVLTIVTPASRR